MPKLITGDYLKTADELLIEAIKKTRVATEKLISCAQDVDHLNYESGEMKGHYEDFIKSLRLCFVLKNAVADITRK